MKTGISKQGQGGAPKHYKHLSLDERYLVDKGLKDRLSIPGIARMLNRPPCTISRELERNRGGADYNCAPAHERSLRRRRHARPLTLAVGASCLTLWPTHSNCGGRPSKSLDT